MSNNDWGKNIAIAGVVGVLGYIGYQVYKSYVGSSVSPGDVSALELEWQNIGELDLQPEFRYDLHPNFPLPRSWIEGEWQQAGLLAPSAKEKIIIVGPVIATDWYDLNVNAKLMARAAGFEAQVWLKNDAYKVGR